MWDLIIVGAGPSGLFAAHELAGKLSKILIIDQGLSIFERKPDQILHGVGGAGCFSAGILNLRPDIGGDLIGMVGERAWDLVKYVDQVFLKYGAPQELLIGSQSQLEELERKAASVGANFIQIPQRLIGTDNAVKVIGNFEQDLKRRGVRFMFSTQVKDLIVQDGVCRGVIANGNQIKSRFVLLAPGRAGASWVREICSKYGIPTKFSPIDVGVRVEVPSIVMDPVIKVNWDPKFHIRTPTYDDFLRTFCTNHMGYVVSERYRDFVLVNGHSYTNIKSNNSNFSFLVRVELTHPLENTHLYGESIARLATTIGGGKPIIQRLGDLRRGRRSNWDRIKRNPVRNTLEDVTPGDISMALPHRIVVDLMEGLEILDKIIPGVASDSTLIYAPEIKFYAMKLQLSPQLESNIKNLFFAGDGAGLSRNLVIAAATGILAAEGILSKIT